jgi:hypothetical protein
MELNPGPLRLELAQLVKEQADMTEKKVLTQAERCGCQERQKRINELCDDLHRIATRTHTGQKEKVA